MNGSLTPVAFAAKNRWLVPLLGEDLAFAVSGDEGVTWSTVTPSGAPNGDVTSVWFVDAQHGEILLSVADGVQALYLSSDGGQSWHPANIP